MGLKAAHPAHASKVTYLTNGFDRCLLSAQIERLAPKIAKPTGGEKRILLLHAGEIYNEQNPGGLLKALCNLQARGFDGMPRMRLRQLGSVNADLDLDATIDRLGIRSLIELESHVPYEASLLAMMQADILVVIQTPRNRIAVPAKLYEYLGIGKPILALSHGGDLDWVLQSSGGTHRIVAPDDAAGIERALVELSKAVVDGTAAPPPASRLYPFTREHMAERLATMLADFTGPTASGQRVARLQNAKRTGTRVHGE